MKKQPFNITNIGCLPWLLGRQAYISSQWGGGGGTGARDCGNSGGSAHMGQCD